MAATLISATGVWAFAAQEAGTIIHGLEEDTRAEFKYQTSNQGERTGVAVYDDSIEVKLTGELAATNGFSGKVGANLTLANAVATTHLNGSNAGRVMIKSVKRQRSNEDWQKVEVGGEMLPYFS